VRRIRRKWLLVGLGVYAALWAATAVWGPAAMEAQQRAYDDGYPARQQPYPDEPLRPAPWAEGRDLPHARVHQ